MPTGQHAFTMPVTRRYAPPLDWTAASFFTAKGLLRPISVELAMSSLRRPALLECPNLHIAAIAAAYGGCAIVDAATARERALVPISLGIAVPVWCSILNRAANILRINETGQTSEGPGGWGKEALRLQVHHILACFPFHVEIRGV